jgi:hypothetical protein
LTASEIIPFLGWEKQAGEPGISFWNDITGLLAVGYNDGYAWCRDCLVSIKDTSSFPTTCGTSKSDPP